MSHPQNNLQFSADVGAHSHFSSLLVELPQAGEQKYISGPIASPSTSDRKIESDVLGMKLSIL